MSFIVFKDFPLYLMNDRSVERSEKIINLLKYFSAKNWNKKKGRLFMVTTMTTTLYLGSSFTSSFFFHLRGTSMKLKVKNLNKILGWFQYIYLMFISWKEMKSKVRKKLFSSYNTIISESVLLTDIISSRWQINFFSSHHSNR